MEQPYAVRAGHLGHSEAHYGLGETGQWSVEVQKVPPIQGHGIPGPVLQPYLHVVNNGKILSRDGKHVGTATGGNARQCRMEGCKGERIGIRWDDGTLTFPCTAAFQFDKRRKMWKLL